MPVSRQAQSQRGSDNGLIRISGNGLGYLATREAYKDYHLIAEFRWGRTNWPWGDRVGRARDSGIFLHAIGPDGNSHDGKGAFMAAIECNIFPQESEIIRCLFPQIGATNQPCAM